MEEGAWGVLTRNSNCWVDLDGPRATGNFSHKSLFYRKRMGNAAVWELGGREAAQADGAKPAIALKSPQPHALSSLCEPNSPSVPQYIHVCFNMLKCVEFSSDENMLPTQVTPWPCALSRAQPQDPVVCEGVKQAS